MALTIWSHLQMSLQGALLLSLLLHEHTVLPHEAKFYPRRLQSAFMRMCMFLIALIVCFATFELADSTSIVHFWRLLTDGQHFGALTM